jgi:hypothetical protein
MAQPGLAWSLPISGSDPSTAVTDLEPTGRIVQEGEHCAIRSIGERLIAAKEATPSPNLGLSRNEYLRRKLEGERQPRDRRANRHRQDWQRSAEVFADLADPTIMDAAWRCQAG